MSTESTAVITGPDMEGQEPCAAETAALNGGPDFLSDLGCRLVARAGIRAGDRVADLGCGAGGALIPAAVAAGPSGQVTGMDPSETMLARAWQAAHDQGLEVTVTPGNVQDPQLPPATLHVIIASGVLQFLPRPRRAVRTWLGLLAPGGRLAVSWNTGQDPAWMQVMAALDDLVPRHSGPGFEEYMRRPPFHQPAGLEGVLTDAGYAGAVTYTESVVVVYTSPEEWCAACQSQGPWIAAWQRIPKDVLPAARGRALALAGGLRGTDGLIRRRLTFGCTVARRPG